MAVYDGNAECYLIETAHLKQKQVVDIENAKNLQLSFFENDQFLLGADSECIWLYDLDKHQVVSSYAVSMRNHAMQLTADISGSYFTLKEIWVTENIRQDEGMSKQNCHISWMKAIRFILMQMWPLAIGCRMKRWFTSLTVAVMQNIRCIHLQIYIKKLRKSKKYLLKSVHEGVILADTFIFRMKQCKPDFVPASGDKVRLFLRC